MSTASNIEAVLETGAYKQIFSSNFSSNFSAII